MSIGKLKPDTPEARASKLKDGLKRSTLSKEEKAAISRKNGAKSASMPRNAYPKSDKLPLEYDVADMYADIYDPRAKIAPEMKIQAATCYMLTGTTRGTARMTGINQQMISEWKNHAQWWEPVLRKIRKDKQDELDAEFTELLHKSTEQLKDRIVNGEEISTKDGLVIKKMSGRDIAAAINTIYDKRTMLRGDPTSITHRVDHRQVLEELRGEFKEMARDEAKQELDKKVVN